MCVSLSLRLNESRRSDSGKIRKSRGRGGGGGVRRHTTRQPGCFDRSRAALLDMLHTTETDAIVVPYVSEFSLSLSPGEENTSQTPKQIRHAQNTGSFIARPEARRDRPRCGLPVRVAVVQNKQLWRTNRLLLFWSLCEGDPRPRSPNSLPHAHRRAAAPLLLGLATVRPLLSREGAP